MLKIIHEDFPVAVIEKSNLITSQEKNLVTEIAEEKRKHFDYDSLKTPASTCSLSSDDKLFSDIFDRVVAKINSIVPITVNEDITSRFPKYAFVNISYSSTEHGVSIWHDATGVRMYHNHKHVPEYVNLTAIYYMEMPENKEGGHLDLKQEYMLTPDGDRIERSKDWRYNKNSFFPDTLYNDKHTIVQEVVSYLPVEDDIVIMPQDLDHRVAPTVQRRIAIVVQMPIKESPDFIIETLKNKSKIKEQKMKKLHRDFPVYVIENFHTIDEAELNRLIPIVVANKEKHRVPGAASFWLMEDDSQSTFARLYNKFEDTLKQYANFDITTDNTRICNIYHSTKDDYVEVIDSQGRPFYHNHKHVVGHFNNTTTIAAVYYLNVPDNNAGPIDFKREFVHREDGTFDEIDRDLEYTQLSKRPFEPIDDVRISTMKEISYQPKTGDLVIFPAYLDHRPHVIFTEGHRIAVNFELKTLQHPDDVVKQIDDYIAKNQ